MVRTPNYDLDIDTTLGGSNASDYIIPSQKAIKSYVDNSTGGNVMWGNITGTLSNQTDLQNALNTKVSKSGDTMTGQLRINRTTGSNFVEMQSGMVQRGTKPTSMITLGFMQIGDKNGQWLGKNQFQYTTTGEAKMELTARSVTSEALAKLSVGFDSNNNAFATAPATSTTRTNATDIVTRGYLNSQITTIQGNKADINFSNVTNTANILMAHNAMPSGTYVDLIVGASGTTYTMPADGWLYFRGGGVAAGTYVGLANSSGMEAFTQAPGADWGLQALLPVSKNDVITLVYGNGTPTVLQFRFYYAKGSESEAQ